MADAKTEQGSRAARPLSPHLQIYRMEISMLMSILHRITGAALYFGTLILAAVLIAAANGPEAYATVTGLLATWPGQFVLFGYTWALIHHLLGGIRHFIWDAGLGFDIPTIDLMSWASAGIAIAATLLIWGYIWFFAGGAA